MGYNEGTDFLIVEENSNIYLLVNTKVLDVYAEYNSVIAVDHYVSLVNFFYSKSMENLSK